MTVINQAPPCPAWCEGKHGIYSEDGWEWETDNGVLGRLHAHDVGTLDNAGVSILANEEAIPGCPAVTAAPALSVWVYEKKETMTVDEALAFVELIRQGVDELARLG